MLRISDEPPDADAWKRDRAGAAQRGEHPLLLAPMRSGYAVLGDTQFLPGYCVLLASSRVEGLNDLMLEERRNFLLDMALLGDAVMAVCQPERVDYAIMGDAGDSLQAHVHARYDWEPEDYRNGSAFSYPRERWTDPAYQYSEERHGELRAMLSDMVLQLVAASEGHVAE